ncbi:hypothetical protein K3217_25405 [bacterium BD-1]|nr:hypothetical protein [Ottowia caeni]
MKTKPRNLGWLLLPVALSGCANVAEKLRSQPVAHYPVGKTDGRVGAIGVKEEKPEDQQQGKSNEVRGIRFYCMQSGGDIGEGSRSKGKEAESCAYVSASYTDIVNFDSTKQVDVDRALDSLIAMSDMNCSNYMHRVFSNRALTDMTGSLAEDLLTSAGTATAHIDPTASAALGVANLVVGKSMDAFHATYFLDKSFQALEAAIIGERQRILVSIIAKRAKAKAEAKPAEGGAEISYGPVAALSDLRAYDDACSFKAGLNALVSLAEKEKEARSLEVAQLEIAPDTLVEARRQLEARGAEVQPGSAAGTQGGQGEGDPGRR